jgi:drug/metabolite transporter (DMT)-like permease
LTPAASRDVAGVALAAGAALCFGTLAIAAKFAYEVGARPLPLLAARFVVAAGLLWIYHRSTGRRVSIEKKGAAKPLLLGSAGYAFGAGLFFFALEHAPAGTVALIFFSYPMWTTLIAFTLGTERPNLRLVSALALGTAGVASIFAVSIHDPLGPLLALAAAVAVAAYFTFAQIVLRDVNASAGAFWTMLGALGALGVASLVTAQGLPATALPHAGALGLATALAFVALFGSVRRIGAPRASVATMLEPVTTIGLAAVLLGEEITSRMILGAVLIIAALPMLAGAGRRRPVPPEPDAL